MTKRTPSLDIVAFRSSANLAFVLLCLGQFVYAEGITSQGAAEDFKKFTASPLTNILFTADFRRVATEAHGTNTHDVIVCGKVFCVWSPTRFVFVQRGNGVDPTHSQRGK